MKYALCSLGVALALLSGCSQSVPGSGQLKTVTPAVAGARTVKLSGTGEVQLTQGPAESLSVTTDDNLLPMLETRLEGQVLILGQKPGVHLKPSKSIVYKLCLKEIDTLELSGAGKVDATGLRGRSLTVVASGAGELALHQLQFEQLTVNLSGAANVVATGQIPKQSLQTSGVGRFDGKALGGETVTVSLSGTGAAVVNATTSLDASVSGTGSITYFGKPTVNKQVTGVGSIEPG